MSRGGKMIVEIETLPFPEGNSRNKYHNVEEAISIVEKSGLKYEVSPLGTTLEGTSRVTFINAFFMKQTVPQKKKEATYLWLDRVQGAPTRCGAC
jgi:uncharacterized protein YqgV (UPF0045/DUF77 family)